jgi:2-succinyl-5-enolpyruvyl-6-hydroxy-3-cyclohexene-1-carboxylate synthase
MPCLIFRNDWDSCILDRIFAPHMKYSEIPTAQLVTYHCKAKGIDNIVISPGSRNAPLTLGFTQDAFFNCYSIVDERSAAFFALGIAQQLKRPVVLLCTSGSALLNYYPAVAEAFYSDIPLVVISADRPSYKIDIGDGQTIRQDGVFERHIGYSTHLKQDVVHAAVEQASWGVLDQDVDNDTLSNYQDEVIRFNEREVDIALRLAIGQKDPVHINIPFEEPLYGLIDKTGYVPHLPTVESTSEKNTSSSETLIDIWNSSAKKLIIVGVLPPGTLSKEIIDGWANDPSVAVLTETTSNLAHPLFINSIDSIIAPAELAGEHSDFFEQSKPELLLTIGGLIVSKKIKAFLRCWKPQQHWHINEKKSLNTFNALNGHIKEKPTEFFKRFNRRATMVKSDYKKLWLDADRQQIALRASYLQSIPFSDLKAFDAIFQAIPKNYQLQLANSSTIRYSQLFDLDPSLRVFCNRGTSGIDGSTSTAVGASLDYMSPTLLITGDLSFLYDINALWNEYIRSDFRIIVINNEGGGIFRILPGKKESDDFARYFETIHDADIENISGAYGFDFISVDGQEELKDALISFFEPGERPKLLEIKTPRTLNDQILLGYFEFLSSAIYSANS